jgi:hypothetical protein
MALMSMKDLTTLYMPHGQVIKLFEDNGLDTVGTGSVRMAVLDVVLKWCRKNCPGRVHYLPCYEHIKWIFNDPNEAMLFKLTWL